MFKKTLIALAVSGFGYPAGYCYIHGAGGGIDKSLLA